MKELEQLVCKYLDYCKYQKVLNEKTLKAYSIDLKQFIEFLIMANGELNRDNLSEYIAYLHKTYKPKSTKRKIACIRAFCNYLEFEEIVELNPFSKIKVKFQEPSFLPKTMPLAMVNTILSTAYNSLHANNKAKYKYKTILRDIAVLELLFATGVRVSELCALPLGDIDLVDGSVRIYGKGSKERLVQIGNPDVMAALKQYQQAFNTEIAASGFFFVNRLRHRLTEQSVRCIINRYVGLADINVHITPHMFRHSFATLLLEEDVDIRYIQKLLGHSSIVTTQIYTHVASSKQRDILTTKHPRNKIKI